MKKIIDVGSDFSLTPSGKYYSDNRYCAQALFIIMHDYLEEGCCIYLEFHMVLTVDSSFLKHLAQLTVANGYESRVKVTKDDKWGWAISRWDKYLAEELKWKPLSDYVTKEIEAKGFKETMKVKT